MNNSDIKIPEDTFLREDLLNIANCDYIKKLYGKSILITGATGLIGSIFIKSLLLCNKINNSNIKVIALARNKEKAMSIFADDDTSLLKFIFCDITDKIETDEEIDFIIHGASVTNSKLMVTEPVENIKTAIDGTFSILNLAKEKNVSGMVYLSSMEAYGKPNPNLDEVREDDLGYIDCLNVRSCYSEGKRMCECLCASFAHEYNVPVKIARLAQTFGAGVSYNETRVFAQFARSLIEEKDIVLHTKGESTGNYCYTSDCIRALMLILTDGAVGDAYTVVNPVTNITIGDMAKLVAKMSDDKIKVVFDIPKDALKYGYAPSVKLKLSADKIFNLGWRPQYDLSQMYDRLIGSMKISKDK
jgi:dTDP-glucose 4,6-dehydratase